ncbi:hypothetical protein [Flavobacterium sp. SM2513]|uniref:hypothetical protein n=1 Tax=Flavobacterium sp. SM2513 TaxID=3424766 RepID=UPI003D7FAA81
MKKLFLVAIATVGFVFSGTAQESQIKVGLDAGIPMGDIKDGSSFNLGANAAYMWTGVAEGLDVGAGVSYNTYFAKEIEYFDGFENVKEKGDNANFLPIYATANYSFTENIFAGADLGYAVGLTDGIDGGFYYQPKVGYQTEMFEVFIGYKGLSSEQTATFDDGFGGTASITATTVFSSINVGFNYKF